MAKTALRAAKEWGGPRFIARGNGEPAKEGVERKPQLRRIHHCDGDFGQYTWNMPLH